MPLPEIYKCNIYTLFVQIKIKTHDKDDIHYLNICNTSESKVKKKTELRKSAMPKDTPIRITHMF